MLVFVVIEFHSEFPYQFKSGDKAVDGGIHSENHECHCPQECLDIKDAVALFTSKAAYLTFEENKKGTIEVGKYADLVVLSDDIFQIDAQKIQDVAVLKTMVNGEFVFSKE